MDRSECVHGILHCLPACVREVRPRESFRSWECEASSHRFSINGLLPQKRREDACALQKSRDCGTKHNAQKFAQARHGEFVLWRTAKTFIDSSTDIANSLSLIPSKVACQAVALCEGLEESLDIISDTAAWPLAHDYSGLAASFSRPLDLQQRVAPLENISAVEARKKMISFLSQRLLNQPVLSVQTAGRIPRGRPNS